MIIVNNLNLPLETDFNNIIKTSAKCLNTDENNIISAKLYRRSVDARHKSNVHFCCSVLIKAKNEEKLLKLNKNAQEFTVPEYTFEKADITPENRPVVVGFGPAGMFCALSLARAGLKPIVIERGKCVEERTADINAFFEGKPLNTESNVQFGEGGAGTFSDGKLNTGIKNRRCRVILEEFVRFGADSDILINAKPHIGTDVLVKVVKNLREEIKSAGGEIRFSSHLDSIDSKNGKICGITVNGEKICCEDLILATGHSARDTFRMLKSKNIEMIKKPFSMGVRIEHLQSDINKALYGEFANHPALDAADYKAAVHLKSGRSVYTFCMCPGGEVINASSEANRIAVNGMSNSARDGINANSALLVNIDPEDLDENNILAGCELQQKTEEAAYKIGGGAVPTVTAGEFLTGKPYKGGKVRPTVKPETVNADFSKIFPAFITDSLKEGILLIDRKIRGFADKDAILTAPETRSSSPVRILRGEDMQSISVKGLYPCGEGAGYAGGIMSAAADGLKIAETVIEKYKNK